MNQIILWLDEKNLGCLESCMKAFSSVPIQGYTWHLQDDIIISDNFKQKTEEYQGEASVVCGYCYYKNTSSPLGLNYPLYMWYSFPCICIKNSIARDCADWFYTKAKYEEKYQKYVSTGKYDDSLFKIYLEETYQQRKIIYNLKPNLVDHIDYLIGGSIVNTARPEAITCAAYFDDFKKIEKLQSKIRERQLRLKSPFKRN